MRRSVHFGAGKIGRGLIGRLLLAGGYKVAFVDANIELVNLLREEGSYLVKTIGEERRTHTVTGFEVFHVSDEDEIVARIVECDLITTSVGPRAFHAVAPTIRRGLEARVDAGNLEPVDIVACENMAGASNHLRSLILDGSSPKCRRFVEEKVGFPESQIGTIAPTSYENLPTEHPLTVFTESNEEFYIDRKALRGNYEKVPGIQFVDDIAAFVDRKVFTVNTGHAVGGYIGYLHGYTYIHEVMADPNIRGVVVGALDEIDYVLVKEHGFDPNEQGLYTRRVIRRFENPEMKDPISRVARDPARKLGPQDRLIRPARLAIKHGLTPANIILGIAAAFFYDAPEGPQAVKFSERVRNNGPEAILREICGLSRDEELWSLIMAAYERIRREKKTWRSSP